MQNIKNVRESTAVPIILSKDLEFELLIRETRMENLRKEKESRDIFNQEDIALENAVYNGNEDEVIHTNGRVIQNNKARHNKFHTVHEEKDRLGIYALATALAQIGVNAAVLGTWISNIGATLSPAVRSSSALKDTFDDKANDMPIIIDGNFVYGGENVSQRTANLLQKRIQRILDLQKQIEETTDPEERAILQDRFEWLVDRTAERGAIYHPQVGWSLSSEYVAELDDNISKRYNEECNDGVICTFSHISRGSHNGRKIKRDIADQFDEDPNETIGKVEVETPQIVAHPDLKFVR